MTQTRQIGAQITGKNEPEKTSLRNNLLANMTTIKPCELEGRIGFAQNVRLTFMDELSWDIEMTVENPED